MLAIDQLDTIICYWPTVFPPLYSYWLSAGGHTSRLPNELSVKGFCDEWFTAWTHLAQGRPAHPSPAATEGANFPAHFVLVLASFNTFLRLPSKKTALLHMCVPMLHAVQANYSHGPDLEAINYGTVVVFTLFFGNSYLSRQGTRTNTHTLAEIVHTKKVIYLSKVFIYLFSSGPVVVSWLKINK